MKKSELRQLIKEEIEIVLKENKKTPEECIKYIKNSKNNFISLAKKYGVEL